MCKPEFFRLLWNIVVFRLVAYLLNMIFLKLRLLYQILCIYKFWYNLSRSRSTPEVLRFHFPFTVPLSLYKREINA